jgi:hypothetical protein
MTLQLQLRHWTLQCLREERIQMLHQAEYSADTKYSR